MVLDTSSFVASIRSSNGAARELLRLIFDGTVTVLMDLKIALEYSEVALRPQHLEVSYLSRTEVLELIEALERFAEPVEIWMRERPLSSDPNDDMVLHLAMSGRADVLVTHNTKHFKKVGARLGIHVSSPSEFLETLDRGEHGDRNE